jgi:PAS domain S-box-containing protein
MEAGEDEQALEPEPGFPPGGVFKAAVDAVVVMSFDGHVQDWNPAAERMFGYSRDTALGRELAELIIPHALRDRHRAALARYVETGQATILDRRLELFGLRADGKLIPVELTVTRVPDVDPPLFAGFVRNQSAGAGAAA